MTLPKLFAPLILSTLVNKIRSSVNLTLIHFLLFDEGLSKCSSKSGKDSSHRVLQSWTKLLRHFVFICAILYFPRAIICFGNFSSTSPLTECCLVCDVVYTIYRNALLQHWMKGGEETAFLLAREWSVLSVKFIPWFVSTGFVQDFTSFPTKKNSQIYAELSIPSDDTFNESYSD